MEAVTVQLALLQKQCVSIATEFGGGLQRYATLALLSSCECSAGTLPAGTCKNADSGAEMLFSCTS